MRYFKEILPECMSTNTYHPSKGYIFDSILSPEELTVANLMKSDAGKLRRQTSSLKGLMDNLENRGHPAAPFVEGLIVELLPFQSQSLQWAIERETVPGGIQSFSWTTLPEIEPAVYFNPVLGRLSKTKPNLVRGGIIAEQMGLGKFPLRLFEFNELFCSNFVFFFTSHRQNYYFTCSYFEKSRARSAGLRPRFGDHYTTKSRAGYSILGP
jgi:hypothetical protein